uniref:Uncharacterized protein n=1 Tax=Romanomermis culicivorax TaxID=13658 RepID=A0A915HT34_ROMCU
MASRDKNAVAKSEKFPKWREIGKLMSLAKPEKHKLIGGVALLAISSTVTMSIPFFMGRILDLIFKEPAVSESKPGYSNVGRIERANMIKEKLWQYMIGLVAFFTIGACATFGRVYLMNFAGERVVNRLRTTAFSSIIRQEIAFFDKSKTGELINRLSNDVWTVGYATTMNISDGLRALVGAIGGTSMMFYVSPKLGIVGLGIVPPVAAIAIVYGRYIRSISKQMTDALAASTDVAEERISNIRTVRAFCAEIKEEKRYNKRIDSVLDIARKESLAKGRRQLFYNFDEFNTSNVFLGISSFYTELMHGIGASTRLFELIERQPLIPLIGGLKPSYLIGCIEFRDLCFSYSKESNETSLLKNLNLAVPARSTLAIVGSSGSGKSTLASLLLRFYDAKKGGVFVDNINIKDLDPQWLRGNIGTVNQEPALFSCSIKENIAYCADNVDSVSSFDIEEAAKAAHAHDFISKFPHGFDTMVGERGLTLSGGQKQRIAIARALLKACKQYNKSNPKILLMDEATSALDAESENAVKETLDSLMHKGDRTIIIIAHRNADQIAVLHEGKIVEIGSYWQLMSVEDGHFRKLVQKQMITFNDESRFASEENDSENGEIEDAAR